MMTKSFDRLWATAMSYQTNHLLCLVANSTWCVLLFCVKINLLKNKIVLNLKDLKKLIESAKHGVIYFSMGTNVKCSTLPNELKQKLIKMFGTLKQIILWKLEESLPNLPENIHTLKWAPQQSILGILFS